MREALHEAIHTAAQNSYAHTVAVGTVIGTLLGWVPAAAGVLGILWYGVLFYDRFFGNGKP